jgi:hypothetical protein
MRTPSIVPHDAERDTYLVLDDFGVDSVALGARPTPKALIARRRSAICWMSNDDGVPMSENTLNKALRTWAAILAPAATSARTASSRPRRPCSTRMARSTAMWWKPNSPTTRRKKRRRRGEVVRRQLGKGDKNKIRSIYNRAAYGAERVRLMQHWCDRLDSLRDGAPAVSLRRSAA